MKKFENAAKVSLRGWQLHCPTVRGEAINQAAVLLKWRPCFQNEQKPEKSWKKK